MDYVGKVFVTYSDHGPSIYGDVDKESWRKLFIFETVEAAQIFVDAVNNGAFVHRASPTIVDVYQLGEGTRGTRVDYVPHTKLEPCPRCGCCEHDIPNIELSTNDDYTIDRVRCQSCRYTGPEIPRVVFNSKQEAINAWNAAEWEKDE